MRRSSTDQWPLESATETDEGPFFKISDSKISQYPDAQIINSGVAYTISPDTYKFDTDTFQLAQLAVVKLKGEFLELYN